jgi:hypothetical protein
MPDSTKAERSAIEAVAGHFSAQWQSGESPPDAYVTVAGRRIALDVAVISQQGTGPKQVAKARLREDRVAQRVLRDIEAAMRPRVPAGKSIILTLGAPIKVPNQLVAVLTNLLAAYLETGTEAADVKKILLGNRVRFRVVKSRSKWNAKVIGCVFTGDPSPGVLANVLESLHAEIAAKAKLRLPRKFTGERWLVLRIDHPIADSKTYRSLYAHLTVPGNFTKILMVFDGGRVEDL